MSKIRAVFNSAIVLYFVICFEILIMISPFAGFFYSAFNPVLLELAKYPATKWLSSFFFTHLLVPPTDFLKFVRVMGSVLFTVGILVFLICAIQVYASKFLKTGPALKGLYSYIRHPQYLALAISGLGLAILWPRFIVVVLWIGMVFIYFLLAKDEERRMTNQFPEGYTRYMENSGMFLPKRIGDFIGLSCVRGRVVALILLSACVLGGSFLLRSYTVKHLLLWAESNVIAIPIMSGDMQMLDHRMPEILKLQQVSSRLKPNENYLAYMMPQQYIMQGLIGNTGSDWQLYKQHHTISMITDFVFHPFGHLAGGHHAMHAHENDSMHSMQATTVRRLIFVKISDVPMERPSDVFSINATRTPEFMIDVDMHSLEVIDVKALPLQTAWGRVPTPTF